MENNEVKVNDMQVEDTVTETVVEETSIEVASTENILDSEEVKKALESQYSKGKYEILKDIGISSVKDIKNQLNELNELRIKAAELEAKANEKDTKLNELQKDMLLKDLNVNTEYKSDFLALVNTRVNETKSFEDSCKEIMELYPFYRGEVTKLGNFEKQKPVYDEEDALTKAFYRNNPKLRKTK